MAQQFHNVMPARIGTKASQLFDWKIEPWPFGTWRISGDLFPGGADFSARLLAVTAGMAITSLGRVKLAPQGGTWIFPEK